MRNQKYLFAIIIWLCCLSTINAQNFIPFSKELKSSQTSPERKVSEQSMSVELEYMIPGAYEVSKEVNGKMYTLLHVEGFGQVGEVGSPSLPGRNDLIALPDLNGEVKKIEILDAEYMDLPDYLMHPMLEPASDTKGAPEPEFVLNGDAYSKDVFGPGKIAEIAGVQMMKNIPLGFLQISPVQYNPVSGIIRVYSKFKVRIVYVGAASSLKAASSMHSERSMQMMRGLVVNPGVIQKGANLKAEPFDGRKDYIIITHSAFNNAAEKLAAWKQQLGYSVEVISKDLWTSEIIDMEVKDRYNNWNPKPDYLVIIGDHDGDYAVPGNLITMYDSDPFTSDNPYACMDGADDYLPDMSRGRLSVKTVAQADMVVDRIIAYEKDPPSGSSYYNTTLNCAYFQHAGNGYAERRFCQTSEEVRDFMRNKGYYVNRIYSTDASNPWYWNDGRYSSGEPIPSELHKPGFPWVGGGEGEDQIIDEFNAGRFLIFHRDHGYSGGRGWADPYFTLEEIDQLTNVDKLPVVFSINCHTGQFIEDECFAEKLQRSSNGGAISVLAAAQSSYSGSNDALVLGFYDAIWNGLTLNFTGSGGTNLASTATEPIYAMGDVMNYGLVRMNETWPAGTDILSQSAYQAMLYHCFGDPSMEIRTSNPSSISASVPSSVSCSATSLSISGCNASDAIATLVMNGKLIAKTQLSGASGTLSFTALGNNTSGAKLTIYKHNYIPKVQNLSITGTCNYAPVSDFIPDAYITMAEQIVKFTDESKYNPTSWQWTFTPNDITYVNGTSSSSQNPEVTFPSVGTYTVALKATNSNGNNTKTKTDYLNIKAAVPDNFIANPAVGTKNQLSWTKYSSGPNVILVKSMDGIFGVPQDGASYNVSSDIPGGGTVIYKGSSSSYTHSGLEEGTNYFYKIWSYSSGNQYSLLGAKTECAAAHAITLPYEEGFEFAEGDYLPKGWKTEINGSGNWTSSSWGFVGKKSLEGTNTDGWAFSAPLELTSGQNYELRFKYTTATDYLNTSIEVSYGTSQSSSGMTSGVIYSDINFANDENNPKHAIVQITVSSTGIYYLGFKQQHSNGNKIQIDDLVVRNRTTGHLGYWDGTGSTNWNSSSNWSDGSVPNVNTNVVIPEWCTSYPIITGSATCKDLYIKNGDNTKLTVNNGGNLNVTGDLWVGDGMSGEFEMNGGTVTCNYMCTHENSLTDINGGTLNINVRWVRTPEDGWHFIRGTAHLSGGNINVATGVTFGGNRFEGIFDGPFYLKVGEDFRNDSRLITATGGTLELTGSSPENHNTCWASNDQCALKFYNIIINGPQTEEFDFNNAGAFNLDIVNDLTIRSGYMKVGASNSAALDTIHIGGDFLLKEGVTFDAYREREFIVYGDLLIEPNVTLNNINNIDVRGQIKYISGGNTYTLTTSVNGNGSVSPSGGTYDEGTVIQITATPDAGYQFDGWSGDASGTSNPLSITMNSNKTITANFSEVSTTQYTLTTSVSGNGSVSPSGGTYEEGTVVQLTATPGSGYQFDNWTGDASGSTNPLSVTMNSNKNITAVFSEITTGDDGGELFDGVAGNGNMDATDGSDMWYIEVPANATSMEIVMDCGSADFDTYGKFGSEPTTSSGGYDWRGYTSGGESNTLDNPAQGRHYIMVDYYSGSGAYTLTATITGGTTPTTYTLSTSVNGNGSISPAGGTYDEGTVVQLTATPEAGNQFDNWSGDASGSTNPISITMDGNKTVTANFSVIQTTQYSLTTSVTGNGSVSPSGGTYDEGTVVQLTATPDAGYQFDNWSGDASGSANPLSVTMNSNKNITAVFSEITTGDDGGELFDGVAGNGNMDAIDGSDMWYIDVPANATSMKVVMDCGSADFDTYGKFGSEPTTGSGGYDWRGYTSGGEDNTVDNPAQGRHYIMVDHYSGSGSYTLTATITGGTVPTTYTLSTSINGNGSVTPSAGTYDEGTVVQLTATPNAGYQFDNWSGDATGSSNPVSVTMNADKNITATFTPTGGCNNYCASSGSRVQYEYIKTVEVGSFSNTSDAQLYSDFTSKTISVKQGQSYAIILTPGFPGDAYNEYFKVWIDYNADCTFDTGELAFDPGSASNAAVSGNITIPASAVIGTTRMRVSMKYSTAAGVCDDAFGDGEVEDYTVNIAAQDAVDSFASNDDPSDTSEENILEVYPNPPVNGIVNIVTSNVNDKIEIYNSLGTKIKSINVTSTNIQLDVSDLEPGLYFIKQIDEISQLVVQ